MESAAVSGLHHRTAAAAASTDLTTMGAVRNEDGRRRPEHHYVAGCAKCTLHQVRCCTAGGMMECPRRVIVCCHAGSLSAPVAQRQTDTGSERNGVVLYIRAQLRCINTRKCLSSTLHCTSQPLCPTASIRRLAVVE